MMLMMPGHGDAPDADVAERRMVKIIRRRSRRILVLQASGTEARSMLLTVMVMVVVVVLMD